MRNLEKQKNYRLQKCETLSRFEDMLSRPQTFSQCIGWHPYKILHNMQHAQLAATLVVQLLHSKEGLSQEGQLQLMIKSYIS